VGSQSDESKCGWFLVRDEERLGRWYDASGDQLSIGYVCEQSATDAVPLLSAGKPIKSGKSKCKEGWILFQESCYRMACEPRTYREAEVACRAQGARLVTVESPAENSFVSSLCGLNSCWLGLYEPEDSEEWQWADGVALGGPGNWSGYANWAPDQPNGFGVSDGDAAVMNGAERGRTMAPIKGKSLILAIVYKILMPLGLSLYVHFAFGRHNSVYSRCIVVVEGILTGALVLEFLSFLILLIDRGRLREEALPFLAFLTVLSFSQVGLCAGATLHLHRRHRWAHLVGGTDDELAALPHQACTRQAPAAAATIVGVPVPEPGMTSVLGISATSSSVEKGTASSAYIPGLLSSPRTA